MNTVDEEQMHITNENKNKIHENCVKLIRMINECEKCAIKEEKETLFIEILEYIYQSNMYECDEKFKKSIYDKIIDFYQYPASSNDFKLYLKHYMNLIFAIII
jgi:hypothetical protein